MPQLQFSDYAPQLIWLAITFIGLYIFLARVALPRIATVIEERRVRIASDLDRAEELKAETERALAGYESAIAEARARAHGIAQETRDKMRAETEARRAEVDTEIIAKTTEAEARIRLAKTAALDELGDVAGDAAGEIVQLLIGGRLTAKDLADAVATARGAE